MDSMTRPRGAWVCQCLATYWGAPDTKGWNPGVTKGTERVEAKSGGTQVVNPFESIEKRSSPADWAITDRVRVRAGCDEKVKTRDLKGSYYRK